jgi:fumarylacetoacetase
MTAARLDETHDPALGSWVQTANAPASEFPIQNLPLGVFRREAAFSGTIGVAIGDCVLDLRACGELGLLDMLPPPVREACLEPSLNALMSQGRDGSSALRRTISRLLRAGAPVRPESALLAAAGVEMLLPAKIGDYTDFYASLDHASNVGRMLRPDNPLFPNYKYVPVAYHGRSSSIVVSGTPVRRPWGQAKPAEGAPVFRPAAMLDYEAEAGVFIGAGNALGEPVTIADAENRLFGFCLLNDWSARDIQAWEYQPLGPFLAKNFATSISPWVVTAEALAPFRARLKRSPEDPPQLPYLHSSANDEAGAFAITVETWLRTERMSAADMPAERISAADFASMFWTPAQMIAHHTSGGCNLRPGDLLGSGTVSGPRPNSLGCLLEMTERGTKPLRLSSGEERRFLEDGDEVILRAYCEREGFRRIGFGECRGTISADAPRGRDSETRA